MKALLIIDMQNDFMPKGPLPVPQADTLPSLINDMMALFPLTLASLDYHPDHHISFADTHPGMTPYQEISLKNKLLKLWPKHCVQGTFGAELAKGLHQEKIDAVFYKGDKAHTESFSVFFDIEGNSASSCDQFLKSKKVDTLYICGVATEYCVFESAKDALKLGYTVFVVTDACKAVDPAKGEQALQELKKLGARLVLRKELSL